MRSATGQKFWLSLGLMTAIGSPGIVAVEFFGAIGAIALTSTVAQATTLSSWSFDPNTDQLEVSLPAGVQPRYFLVAEPARIVLDLPSTQVGAVPTEGSYSGAIQQIRVAQFQPDLARIVLQLSPSTVLAPGQVKLEKVGSVEQGAQRWTLRPLVADASTPIASASEPAQPVAPSSTAPSQTSVITAPTPLSRSEVSSAPTGLPPVLPPIAPTAPTVAVPESASLPPVLPRAVSIPIPVENAPQTQPPRPSTSDRQAARESRAAERQARRPQQEARQAERQATSQSAPQTDPQTDPQTGLQQPTSTIAQSLPPATFTPPAARTVNVPALNPPAAPMTLAANDSIPFGQPLPGSTDTPSTQPTPEPTIIPDRPNDNPATNDNPASSPPPLTELSVDSTFNTLIPADTQLSLYYPQETPLKLTTEPQEQVLFLAQNVRDRAGNLLIPVDSQVIGSFESSNGGSKFIARSIRIQGENHPISAESDSLGGKREVSSNRIVRTSAAGAVVGLLLGLTTGIGVLAGVALGALSGAGSVFVSAPQAATIQPYQPIQVRLLEDLPR